MTSQLPPSALGRYELVERIGQGAMGSVFRARDTEIGRDVALKTYRLGAGGDEEQLAELRKRLRREARAAGRISHPGVVTIFDVVGFEDEAGFFIVMEYVDGESLADRLLRHGPFTLQEIFPLLRQIADAVDHLHDQGVIHRDLKPANILLTADDRVKITDFGIARPADAGDTHSTTVMGTPQYMAPEQIRAETPTPRTDVFALGVLLYELLSGERPFAGGTVADITHAILNGELTPLSEHLPNEADARVCAVVERALARVPEQRYEGAHAMLSALVEARRDLLDTSETRALEPGEGGRRPRRRPTIGMIAVAAVILVAAGLLFATFGVSWEPGPGLEPVVEGQRIAYAQVFDRGRRALALGDPESASIFFQTAAQLTEEPERALELAARAQSQVERRRRLEAARELLAAGRPGDALAIARELLAERPEGDEAPTLLAEIEEQLAAVQEPPPPASSEGAAPRQATSSRGPRSSEPISEAPAGSQAAPPVNEFEPAEVAELAAETAPIADRGTATLVIEMKTRAPRGLLTVFVGEEQVFLEPFDFTERRWFSRVFAPGTVEAELPIPADVAPLELLLARDDQVPILFTFHTRFEAGSRRFLDIELPKAGKPEVKLR